MPHPGFDRRRLVRLIDEAVRRCQLDLAGKVVLTEAATGAYAVTPVIAAVAGAQTVFAVARSTRFGTRSEAEHATLGLSRLAGVDSRVEVLAEKTREACATADIVTNSGNIRPIDATMVGWMKATAVVPLMYEAWELRAEDVDVAACRARGIQVAGTNERHAEVNVFPFLGVMAVKLLLEAGFAVLGNRVLVLCDNAFGGFIAAGIRGMGGEVTVAASLAEVSASQPIDAVLVALRPRRGWVLGADEVRQILALSSGATVAQFWGDIDRDALTSAGALVWPPEAPPLGHMAILPSAVGPEPIVRLQTAGLKVGQVLGLPEDARTPADLEWLQWP